MEKRSPHYKLDTIKETFQKVSSLRMSKSADQTCFKLGLKYNDVVFVIQALTHHDFYKSMTTYADHRVWQDVYHFEYNNLQLYIKFMVDSEGYLIVSFKER
jgi:motility quorum-sensing regulator/GCU-specific mRNA interferase toxin